MKTDIAHEKELPDIEYEVKFNIRLLGRGNEPSMEEFLVSLDGALKKSGYSVYSRKTISSGTNYYIGTSLDESFVIMESEGKLFLKEKGEVTPVNAGIEKEEWIIKRKERVYEASIDEIIKKTLMMAQENSNSSELKYLGKIVKEKGDIYAVDKKDGRIYCLTISRSHSETNKESGDTLLRQLEIEYVGCRPKILPKIIKELEKSEINPENKIVLGLTSIASTIYERYCGKKINDNYKIWLEPTKERKYDFVQKSMKKR